MNSLASVWQTLGIEPTQDQRAIRVAYARQLKLIDVDSDPQAFIALRSAFETAQQQTRWADFETQWVTPSEAAEPAVPVEAGAVVVDAPTGAGLAEAHAQALYRLLYELTAPEGGAVAGDPAALMLEHWRSIAADPRLQAIGHFADAERWLAELIARTIPSSDPLVRPASDFFGWASAADTAGQSKAIADVVERARSLDFRAAIVKRDHPLHGAWIELTTPADEGSKRGWAHAGEIHHLLSVIRSNYPDLESDLDWYRVYLWEGDPPGYGSWLSDIPIGFFVVGGILISRFMGLW